MGKIRVRKVVAGKFNRYAGWHLKDYFQHLGVTLRDLVFKNIAGFFKFITGYIQSFMRLASKRNRPDVIFLKGGFVGLPVGLVAGLFKIPYIIHESDATPGLTNRILMKKARVIATGFENHFNDRCINVGIPVSPDYKVVGATRQKALKQALGFEDNKPLVIVTGGSQGSENINDAMRKILPDLIELTSVGLVAGKIHYPAMADLRGKYPNFQLWDFSTVMHELMGAADVVVSRAGATTIAELAALKKATILVPFERLAGNHQSKNAHMLEQDEAAVVVSDEKMQHKATLLLDAIKSLITSKKKREALAQNLHKTARPDAAKKLANLILEVGDNR